MEALSAANFEWWSILPPLMAIILALVTKEVISSLLVGILAGALIYSHGNPVGMIVTAFKVMGDRMGSNVNILIFLGLLGALVFVVTRAGGSMAYGAWAAKKIKTRKGASLATFALGCFLFIDDYFNCLTVGTVMQPVTDKHGISRAKLAYLLDATAAPICIIAPVSSWGASVATYIQDAGVGNGMSAFMEIIPYNLYAILTIIMVLMTCVTKINFGPMARFEKSAALKGDVGADKARGQQNEIGGIQTDGKGHVFDLIIPIGALIVFTMAAMVYTGGGFDGRTGIVEAFGQSDSSLSLVMGSFLALVTAFLLFLPRKVLSFKDFMEGITSGIKSMVPAFTILILAWTIGGICSLDYLNTGGFVGNLVKEANFPVMILPVIVFLVGAFLGFATGTSWGTMAILIPIGAAICTAQDTAKLMYPVLGAILAGAVYGDHISPISDTTILSSAGAGCDHMDHVSTQIIYATCAAVCCLVGYLMMGFVPNAALALGVCVPLLMILVAAAGWFGRRKNPILFSDSNKSA